MIPAAHKRGAPLSPLLASWERFLASERVTAGPGLAMAQTGAGKVLYAAGWTERVRVGGVKFLLSDFTGTASEYVKIYFDAATPPAYTDETTYELAAWGDEFIVVRMEDLRANVGDYIVPRG